MKTIAPGFHTFTGLIAGRVYLIVDDDGLTLVDASIPPSGAKILKQIADAGHAHADVKRIVITHGHPDHVGGLHEVQQATGAQVIAHRIEVPVIQGEVEVPRNKRTFLPDTIYDPGTTVDRVVEDDEILSDVMGGIRVVFTPGHAPGHIALWQPERRILICGDVLFNLIGMSLPPRPMTSDPAQNIISVGRIAALNADICAFGHGPVLVKDTTQTLRRFASRFDKELRAASGG